MFDLISHKIYTGSQLPPPNPGQLYEVWLAGNGLFLRAEREGVRLLLPVVGCHLPGLPALKPYFRLDYPPIPRQIMGEILQQARLAAGQDGKPLEKLFHLSFKVQDESEEERENTRGRGREVREEGWRTRTRTQPEAEAQKAGERIAAPNPHKEGQDSLPQLGRGWQLEIPEQVQSGSGVYPTNSGPGSSYERALLELHSHHYLPAYFSPVDDEDEERSFRLFAVIGRIFERPTIRLRVGVFGYFWQLPPQTIFDLEDPTQSWQPMGPYSVISGYSGQLLEWPSEAVELTPDPARSGAGYIFWRDQDLDVKWIEG